jgi:hypothetical protein
MLKFVRPGTWPMEEFRVRLERTEHLRRRGLQVTEKDRIDLLKDVGTHVEKVSLVLDRNQSSFRAIVLCYLKRLSKRTQRLDISLNAHVSQDQQRGTHGALLHC